MTIVKRMQLHYEELLEGDAVHSKDLTPGQMLLMVFNNLFIRLEHEFADLMSAMDSLKVPAVWKKVDAVREGTMCSTILKLLSYTLLQECSPHVTRYVFKGTFNAMQK